MKDSEITALARGLVPYVREVVGEALAKAEPADIGKAVVPPELAAEVAGAVRMLHETPEPAAEEKAAPRVTRIERDGDGNLVPIYEP